MRVFKTAVALVLLSAVLSGCSMAQQVEHNAYVITMGVDLNDIGDCVISIQIPSITPSGSSEGENSSASYVISTASAPTFSEALILLEAVTPRKLNYRQMISLVASQKIASSPLFPALMTELMHTYGLFGSAQLIICAGNAKDFLSTQTPEIGTRLSTSVNAMLENYRNQGFIPEALVSQVHYLTQSRYSDPVAIYAATSDERHFRNVAPDAVEDSYPGSLPSTGLAVNEYMGAALLQNGVMVGVLNGTQTQILNMILGKSTDMTYFVDGYTVQLKLKKPVSNRVDICKDIGKPEINLNFDLAVKALTVTPDIETIRARFTDDVVNLIETCRLLKTEPFGFAFAASRQFKTLDEWNAYQWRESFANANMQITVSIESI